MPIKDPYFDVVKSSEIFTGTQQSTAIAKFIRAYKDVSFGWNLVRYLVRNKLELPSIENDEYIVRAYRFERYGIMDDAIFAAIAFNADELKEIRAILQSCLVVENVDIKEIAEKLGINEDSIRAYESLFYNVIDRSKEAAWLATIIYPETRFVEMSPTYVQDAGHQWLLKRSGYNNGFETVAHFSGLRTNMNRDMSNAASKMENALMVNGYLLATNGYINQRDAQGIFHAKTIISAEKQGGNQQVMADDGPGDLGLSIFTELEKYGNTTGLAKLDLRNQLTSGDDD